jgi:hypothetical protein
MTDGNEMESAWDERIGRALREGVTSTPAARDRVMAAVRASARPVRGAGDTSDLSPALAAPSARPLWRSPGAALLAAASIAGIIALVRAVGVEGPIPEIPGQPVAHRAAPPRVAAARVAPAAGGSRDATPGASGAQAAKVQFVLVAPKAHHVVVVGDFNDWDPAAAPLAATSGVWSRELEVPFGRHDYAFVVDGNQWVADPSAPRAPADEFGNGYSVIVVGEHR